MSNMNLQTNQTNELLYVGFNQDYGCFACGTDTGFKIFNCEPFSETFQRQFNKGGIGYVEMLFRCNILALVGGGRNPRYPPTKVMIWDDHQNRCIGELSFRSAVRAVKLRRNRVVVVLEYKIYVYNFADLKLVDQIETTSNERGLCALCPYSNNTVLVCPGLEQGLVRVELYDINRTTLIAAHEGPLACFALNYDGTRLATASEKGTLIRIFDTKTGNALQELRRGVDRADIYSIAFNFNTYWLAVSSDKGTVHIFSIKDKCAVETKTTQSSDQTSAPQVQPSGQKVTQEDDESNTQNPRSSSTVTRIEQKHSAEPVSNPKSSLSFLKSFLPKYFSSEWSFAQYRVPDGLRCIVAFGAEKNSIVVVSADGMFYKALFDPATPGAECVPESSVPFIQISTDAHAN